MTCTCVYATADNTPAVRSGHEMGGYLKEECEECKAKYPDEDEEGLKEALPYIKPSDLDTFVIDDQPTRCPICQARTDFLTGHGKQLHWCLNPECQLIFMAEDEE